MFVDEHVDVDVCDSVVNLLFYSLDAGTHSSTRRMKSCLTGTESAWTLKKSKWSSDFLGYEDVLLF